MCYICLQIVEGQRNAQTLENVVSKFNVKLGGLNYTLTPIPGHDAAEYMKQDRLILGVAQASSAEGKEQRTVYGYAANPKSNPNEFVGGFTIHKDVDVSGSIKIGGRDHFDILTIDLDFGLQEICHFYFRLNFSHKSLAITISIFLPTLIYIEMA